MFFLKEGIMSVLRYTVPFICALIGLYCVIWAVIASSYPTSLRGGAAFIGVLFLLLALVYVRMSTPQKQ